MEEFEKIWSYSDFQQEVIRNSRYFWNDRTKQFLEAVKASWLAEGRVCDLNAGDMGIWRAQRGCLRNRMLNQDGEYYDDELEPFPEERMKPLLWEAKEGRANPKGIPMLYTANNRETAIKEVRPRVGDCITVAELRIDRLRLKLIDCSKRHGQNNRLLAFKNNPTSEERIAAVWTDIDGAFARPITNCDMSADYAPTQILAEYFRHNGFDGIVYKSAVSKTGYNRVLFDPDSAEIVNRQLVEVVNVSPQTRYVSGYVFPEEESVINSVK